MITERQVLNYLKKHNDLMESDNLQELYNQTYYWKVTGAGKGFFGWQEKTRTLTQFFLDNGVDPLEFMNTVPPWYMYWLDRDADILPNNKVISSNAFAHSGIRVADLSTVEWVQDYVFKKSKVEKIIFPTHKCRLGTNMFEGCTNLTDVTIPNSVLQSNSGSMFYDCPNLQNVTFEDNCVGTIPASMFIACNSLQSVELPKGISGLGSYAFFNCDKLEDIIMHSKDIRIDKYALSSSTYPYTLHIYKDANIKFADENDRERVNIEYLN